MIICFCWEYALHPLYISLIRFDRVCVCVCRNRRVYNFNGNWRLKKWKMENCDGTATAALVSISNTPHLLRATTFTIGDKTNDQYIYSIDIGISLFQMIYTHTMKHFTRKIENDLFPLIKWNAICAARLHTMQSSSLSSFRRHCDEEWKEKNVGRMHQIERRV